MASEEEINAMTDEEYEIYLTCKYCNRNMGGFHGCRAEARHTIERYLSDSSVLDVDELTDLIGNLGYWGKDGS